MVVAPEVGAAVRDRRQATARRSASHHRGLWSVACSLLLLPAICSAATYALIVSGLGGEPQYEQRFREQANALSDAAVKLTGDRSHVTTLLGERTTRESVRQAVQTLAGKTQPGDRVLIVLIGHGSFDGEEYRFNVTGPDPTATELGALFNGIGAGEQLIVNATSASGAVVERWQREGRAVVSATKNGGERTATRFAQFWLQAVSSEAADVNKDDIVTAQEAFEFASRKVADSYKTEVSLATEHPRLEGRGAERFQVARLGAASLAGDDATLNSLLEQRVRVERDIDAVKQRKASLALDAYYDELETVLVRLALLQKKIDARQSQIGGTSTSMNRGPTTGGTDAH